MGKMSKPKSVTSELNGITNPSKVTGGTVKPLKPS